MNRYPASSVFLAAVGLGAAVAQGWLNWVVGVVFLSAAFVLVLRQQRKNRKG